MQRRRENLKGGRDVRPVAHSWLIAGAAPRRKGPAVKTTTTATALALLLSFGLALPAAAQTADIVDTLKQRDQFSQLAQAIEQAGVQDALKGEGPFTVFAPTNQAFQQLPQGALDRLDQQQLQTLLQHHVIEGERIASDEIPERLEPMAGGRIDVSLAGDEIMLYSAPPVGPEGQQQGQQVQQQLQQAGAMTADIERARVTKGDIQAANGVIHAISAVLVPPDMEQALRQGQGGGQAPPEVAPRAEPGPLPGAPAAALGADADEPIARVERLSETANAAVQLAEALAATGQRLVRVEKAVAAEAAALGQQLAAALDRIAELETSRTEAAATIARLEAELEGSRAETRALGERLEAIRRGFDGLAALAAATPELPGSTAGGDEASQEEAAGAGAGSGMTPPTAAAPPGARSAADGG